MRDTRTTGSVSKGVNVMTTMHRSTLRFGQVNRWLAAVSFAALLALVSPIHATADDSTKPAQARILFSSQGRAGIMNADGSGLRYFGFKVPGQATWQAVQPFPDGKRIVLLSMEPRRD